LQIEVEKAVKKIRRDQKTTGYDDKPGNVLRLLGKYGLKTRDTTYENINEPAHWPVDFAVCLR